MVVLSLSLRARRPARCRSHFLQLLFNAIQFRLCVVKLRTISFSPCNYSVRSIVIVRHNPLKGHYK